MEDEAEYFPILTVVEKGSEFGFGCRGNDKFADTGHDVYWAIKLKRLVILWVCAKEVKSAETTVRFWFGEVGCIRVNVEYHCRWAITYGGIVVCGEVVEEMVQMFFSLFCWAGLGGGDGAEGDEGGDVHCTGVIKDGTDDLLYSLQSVLW